MMELMVNLNKEEGMTILYTSHYLEQAEMFCDRIGILNKGELVALGTPVELLHYSGSSHLEALFLQLTCSQIVIR
jgi:ABC-2 type transport system ATP-binding protein